MPTLLDVNITDYIDNIYDDINSPVLCNSGVYIKTYTSGQKYIGSAKSVIERLGKNKYDNVKKISVYLTDTVNECRLLEKKLIRKLQPGINLMRYDTCGDNKKTTSIKVPIELREKLKKIQAELYLKYEVQLSLVGILLKIDEHDLDNNDCNKIIDKLYNYLNNKGNENERELVKWKHDNDQ